MNAESYVPSGPTIRRTPDAGHLAYAKAFPRSRRTPDAGHLAYAKAFPRRQRILLQIDCHRSDLIVNK